MNKNDAAQYLPLVQALADGKVIQEYRHVDLNKQAWMDCVNPEFDRYPASNYRIKPEPREVWINKYADFAETRPSIAYKDEFTAKANAGHGGVPTLYREVLE